MSGEQDDALHNARFAVCEAAKRESDARSVFRKALMDKAVPMTLVIPLRLVADNTREALDLAVAALRELEGR